MQLYKDTLENEKDRLNVIVIKFSSTTEHLNNALLKVRY